MSDGLGFAEVLTCLKLFEETHAGPDRLRSSLVYTGRGVNLAKGSTGDLPQVCLDSWRIGTSGSQARSARRAICADSPHSTWSSLRWYSSVAKQSSIPLSPKASRYG